MIGVQPIGNYIVNKITKTLDKSICFTAAISGISPLTMVGKCDEDKKIYLKQVGDRSNIILDINKNLDQLLSRNKDDFCRFNSKAVIGEEVRYSNDTDFLLIENTAFIYDLIQSNDRLYTFVHPDTALISNLQTDSQNKHISLIRNNDFDWRPYYDMFIKEILKQYAPNKIVLLRTHSAEWYLEKNLLCRFDDHAVLFKRLVEDVDNYFARKTGCYSIDLAYEFIPQQKAPVAAPFVVMAENFFKELKPKLLHLFLKEDTSPHNNTISEETVFDSLLSRVREEQCVKGTICTELVQFLLNIFARNSCYTISDYIREMTNEDMSIVSPEFDFKLLLYYTANMKCSLDDIISIFKLYTATENSVNSATFISVAANLCSDLNNQLITKARKLVQDNIAFLNSYEYIHLALSEDFFTPERIYISLGSDNYLIIDSLAKKPFDLVNLGPKESFNPKNIIDNNYCCGINEANLLCSSYAFYIDRAQRGEGTHPVTLTFSSQEQFEESLRYVIYRELLESEPFLFSIAGTTSVMQSKCNPITDLSFLFNQKARIVRIQSGLNDQICHYMLARVIEEQCSCNVWYDDTFFNIKRFFNGFEVTKIINEDISGRCFSHILSQKLMDALNGQYLCNVLYENGLSNIVFITHNRSLLESVKPTCDIFASVNSSAVDRVVQFTAGIPYYYYLVRIETLLQKYNVDFKSKIKFPPFSNDDMQNKELLYEIENSDSIIMHVRRGDYVSLGWNADSSFFADSVKKFYSLPQYSNKRYYIFSDDINWCRNNLSELGLDIADVPITFVDHNKGENSFRDLQLMSAGKMMIITQSYFGVMAFLMNENCEMLLCSKDSMIGQLKSIGWANKYSTDSEETK